MPRVFFSSRHGGASQGSYASLNLGNHVGDDSALVQSNRLALQNALSLKHLVFMNQTHSADIVEIPDEIKAGSSPNADALMTNHKGIGLAVMVADCVPLLLASPSWVAAVHVGRVGLLSGIVEKTLARFREANSPVTEAWIGPHICSDCYEVSSEMYEDVTQQRNALATDATRHCLNLRAGVVEILENHSVAITDLGICTVESKDHFSYRRDGVTGRFAGVISL
jgi:hypothetical protein